MRLNVSENSDVYHPSKISIRVLTGPFGVLDDFSGDKSALEILNKITNRCSKVIIIPKLAFLGVYSYYNPLNYHFWQGNFKFVHEEI